MSLSFAHSAEICSAEVKLDNGNEFHHQCFCLQKKFPEAQSIGDSKALDIRGGTAVSFNDGKNEWYICAMELIPRKADEWAKKANCKAELNSISDQLRPIAQAAKVAIVSTKVYMKCP